MKDMNGKNYSINAPLETHWMEAPCTTDNCGKFNNGWMINIDLELVLADGRALGQQQYDYIKYVSGRKFKEERSDETHVMFIFYPEQQCFEQHKVKREDVDALYNRQQGRAASVPLTVREMHKTTMEPERFMDGMNEDIYQHNKEAKEG